MAASNSLGMSSRTAGAWDQRVGMGRHLPQGRVLRSPKGGSPVSSLYSVQRGVEVRPDVRIPAHRPPTARVPCIGVPVPAVHVNRSEAAPGSSARPRSRIFTIRRSEHQFEV